MVVAPHPDDESLATAGLLQAALAAAGAVRIVYLTDGDNNPWAQLVNELRWPFAAADRRRWGALRRQEALAALLELGVPSPAACFLGFPDQGLTDLLARGDGLPAARLAAELSAFRPTVLAAPAMHDRHPDHSAAAVFTALALADRGLAERPARRLHYLVHAGRSEPRAEWRVGLGVRERDRMLRAVLCHRTQLRWHDRAFRAAVKDCESFEGAARPGVSDARHRVRLALLRGNTLWLELSGAGPIGLGPGAVHVALECRDGCSVRRTIELGRRRARVRDGADGEVLAVVPLSLRPGAIRLRVPLEPGREPHMCFVKHEWPRARRLGFLDGCGWRAVPPGYAGRAGAAEREGEAEFTRMLELARSDVG